MTDPVQPDIFAVANHRLAIVHVETALVRWRERNPTVLHNTVSPVEALSGLHARMTARAAERQTTVR
jgi:hypothetical protein